MIDREFVMDLRAEIKKIAREEHDRTTDKRTETHACDLINRQAAIEALHDEIVRRRISEDTNDDGALDEFDTESILRALPSVDAVPVVRCKDCKRWHDWNGECYGNGNMGYGVRRKADDFCSLGKRKDG